MAITSKEHHRVKEIIVTPHKHAFDDLLKFFNERKIDFRIITWDSSNDLSAPIRPHWKVPKWTRSQEKYLLDCWGTMPVNQIARILNRTKKAVKVKYNKLKEKEKANAS